MASAGSEVHVLGGHLAVLQACVDDGHGLLKVFDGDFHQVLHKDLAEFLPDLQVLILGVEQVLNLLLVYLIEREVHLPVEQRGFGLQPLLLEEAEDEVERGRDDALGVGADLVEHAHGVRLACACLTIDEIAPMVAIQHVENQGQGALLEDLALGGLLSEDLAVLEISLGALLVVMKSDPARLGHLHTAPQRVVGVSLWGGVVEGGRHVFINLVGEGGPDPHEYLDALLLGLAYGAADA